MLLHLLLTFVPFVHSGKLPTQGPLALNLNKTGDTLLPNDTHSVPTNVTVITEEVTMVKGTSLNNLLKGNTSLLDPDKEPSKKVSASVARKGVDFFSSHTTNSSDVKLSGETNNKVMSKETRVAAGIVSNITQSLITTKPPLNISSNQQILNKTSLNDTTAKANVTINKPKIVSYESLNNVGQSHNTRKTTDSTLESQPSSETLTQDQLQSPNKDTIIKSKVHSLDKTPGILMPLVITILVVPVFAVLGYMGLRRGHEAWKNRHYKRMDFLLDGMYND